MVNRNKVEFLQILKCSIKKMFNLAIMKTLLHTFFILFTLVALSQQGPKILFEQTTINYGKITQGEDDGIWVFKFKNNGDQPLLIVNAQSTCGCTVPIIPKDPIAPGDSGSIEVKYDMRLGPIRKSITIETNEKNKDGGRVYLRIIGEVLAKKEKS